MNWYVTALKKFADFDGRARRKEFWMFALINFLISIAISIVEGVVGLTKLTGVGTGPVQILYSLAMIVPSIAVAVRRLHDTNRSGLFLLLAFIPFFGALILLYFYIKEGDAGSNKFGSDPKLLSAD